MWLTGIGLVLGGVFLQPEGRELFGVDLPAEIRIGVALGLGVLAWAVLAIGHVRVRRGREELLWGFHWWATPPALFATCLALGAGLGALGAWTREWAGDEEGFLTLLLGGVIVSALMAVSERGRLPALALLAMVLLGTLVAVVRLELGRGGGARADEVLLTSILLGLLLPLLYLMVSGMLGVLGEADVGDARAGAAAELPFDVLVDGQAYLVAVEVPGLPDASAVELAIEGRWLRLSIPIAAAPDDVVYSTRRRGRFPLEVELPRSLQDKPWGVEVAHGVLSVRVAPLFEE